MSNKQEYCWQLQNHVWIQNFRRSNWKITMIRKSADFFVVIWHGRPCQEMCGTILWVGEQNDSATLQSIYSMHRWPPFQRRRNEICWRIVTSMLSNCSEMLVLGTYWKTWYSMVSEQTRTIDHEMDQSLWQTIISFDLLHPSHTWLQTVLPFGVILPNNADKKYPKSECPDIFGYVYQRTNGPNHGPVWKTQSFLLSEICTVILWQDCYGKGNLRNSYWNMDGRKFQIGNAYSYTVKKDDSYRCMWTI